MIPVFDTNILIDHLKGYVKAQEEIEKYTHSFISIMTWVEVMVGVKTEQMKKQAEKLLSNFEIINLTQDIAEEAVLLRQNYKMALPDAIIWATAKVQNTLLVTRNVKDFPSGEPDIRIPYSI